MAHSGHCRNHRFLQIANLRLSKVRLYGSTNLHDPKVVSCAGFAKRYAGYNHD
jgi:hypothetical protein